MHAYLYLQPNSKVTSDLSLLLSAHQTFLSCYYLIRPFSLAISSSDLSLLLLSHQTFLSCYYLDSFKYRLFICQEPTQHVETHTKTTCGGAQQQPNTTLHLYKKKRLLMSSSIRPLHHQCMYHRLNQPTD